MHRKSPRRARRALQVLAYAGYLGGNTTDRAFSIAVDGAGNAYVAGSTESANFPIVNALQPQGNGATDAFVARISADGTTLSYATYLGGSGLDVATGIAVDGGGNLYVTGFTGSGDFPVTPGVVQTTRKGNVFDAFVTKISPSGALIYSTYLGGTEVDIANAIAVDAAGNAHLAGYTCSSDFPVKNASQPLLNGGPPSCASGQDAFVATLDANAAALLYSTYFGGSGKDEATSIALDPAGRAFIAGYSASSDLPAVGASLTAYGGARDAIVARFGVAGALEYSSYFGGSDDDTATGLAIAKNGNVYVAGYSASSDLPTPNAFQPSLHGFEDGFVARLALTATNPAIVYATYLGGGDSDRLHAIAADPFGNAYVTGFTESLDFPTIAPTQPALAGVRDAVVARLDPSGTPTYASFLGGSEDDTGRDIAISNPAPGVAHGICIAGETLSTDLATSGAFQPSAEGAFDGFVAKIAVPP